MESTGAWAKAAAMRNVTKPFLPHRRLLLRACGVLPLVCSAPTLAARTGEAEEGAEVEVVRRLQLALTLVNSRDRPLFGQRIWCYLPVDNAPTQRLLDVEVVAPHRVERDLVGHTVLEMVFDRFPPLAQKVIVITLSAAMRRRPRTQERRGEWLAAERFLEVDDPEIIALARQLRRDDDWKTAQAIFDWVVSNLTYGGYLADDYGALYALRNRRGDCTEYAYLVVALLRANGIHSRMVGGYVLDDDPTLRADKYHNWAEAYIDGTWRVVDAQRSIWLTSHDRYLAFRLYRSESPPPLGTLHRVRVEGEIGIQM